MNFQLILMILEATGLCLGIFGTLLLIFSTKILTFEGIRFNGIPATITNIDKNKFRNGLYLILFGFALQIIPVLCNLFIELR